MELKDQIREIADPELRKNVLSIEKAGDIAALAQIVIDMVKPIFEDKRGEECSNISKIERLNEHLMNGVKESDFNSSEESDDHWEEVQARAEEIERIYVELLGMAE